MVPGIQNFGNLKLKQNIIFGWCIQDNKVPFKINWRNKIIILTDLGQENNDNITHRLQDNIFDIL